MFSILRQATTTLKKGKISSSERFQIEPFIPNELEADLGHPIDGLQSCPLCGAFLFRTVDLIEHYRICKKGRDAFRIHRLSLKKSKCSLSKLNNRAENADSLFESASDTRLPFTREEQLTQCKAHSDSLSSRSTLTQRHNDEHPDNTRGICPVCSIECVLVTHLNLIARHRCMNAPVPYLQDRLKCPWPRTCSKCDVEIANFEEYEFHRREINQHNLIMHERESEASEDDWQHYCWPCGMYFASEPELEKHRVFCSSPLKFLTRVEGELMEAAAAESVSLVRIDDLPPEGEGPGSCRSTPVVLHGPEINPAVPIPSVPSSSAIGLCDHPPLNGSSLSTSRDSDFHESAENGNPSEARNSELGEDDEPPPDYFSSITNTEPQVLVQIHDEHSHSAGTREVRCLDERHACIDSNVSTNGALRTNEASAPASYECPLCFNDGDDLSALLCGHIFCTRCISESLERDPVCPVCRRQANKQDIRRVFLSN